MTEQQIDTLAEGGILLFVGNVGLIAASGLGFATTVTPVLTDVALWIATGFLTVASVGAIGVGLVDLWRAIRP